MNRRWIALAMAGALCLNLSGCARNPSIDGETEIALPEPASEADRQIFGEKILSEPQSVTLYYISGDGNSFSTVTRNIIPSATESICESAVRLLLYDADTPERQSSVPAGTELLSVECACGTATINLSLNALNAENDLELLKLVASISNTVLSLEHIDGVNVLINHRAESIAGLPTGLRTQFYTSITPTYAQLSAEHDYFLESETETIQRNAILYFPSDGKWLTPELRQIDFDSSDYASALIRELRKGPALRSCATSAFPESADLLLSNPTLTVTSSGERVLHLEFSATLLNYLALVGLEEWELLGSVVLTVTSFVPEIDAVQITIDGKVVQSCNLDNLELRFPDGLIRRSDFSNRIGGTVSLYLPNENGTLNVVERAESMVRAGSPQSILRRLFIEASESSAFPSGISDRDLLGMEVEDGIASVNLSANFYRQSQALDAAGERGVVYAIVNTLCAMDNISGVRFYIEGISAETLSGSIYLKGVLLPNPGAVASGSSAAPEITATP